MDNSNNFVRFVNIGESITNRLKELNMTKASFSRLMEMNPSNLNKFLKKQSVETEILIKISTVLKYNFFAEFVYALYDAMKSSATFALKDQNFYVRDVNIGEAIARQMRVKGITQNELVTKLRATEDCSKMRQADISAIVNSKSIDTNKLYHISIALDYNFFTIFCETEEEQAMWNKIMEFHYSSINSGKEFGGTKPGTRDLLKRLEELAIENVRLRNDVVKLKKENEELKKIQSE